MISNFEKVLLLQRSDKVKSHFYGAAVHLEEYQKLRIKLAYILTLIGIVILQQIH